MLLPYCIGQICFKYSYLLWLIPLLLFIIPLIIKKNLVKFRSDQEEKEYKKEKYNLRKIMMITRIVIFSALLIALASPYILEEKIVPGDISLTILVDNSSSFGLFDTSLVDGVYKELKDRIPVEMRSIGRGDVSAIGDGILQNIQGDDNVLVVSDGYSNKGKLLGDMISFANGLNSTINTIRLKPVESDVGVVIEGPSQTILDVEELFNVVVNNVGEEISYHITILVDGEAVRDEDGSGASTYPVLKSFSDGYHRIEVRLTNVGEGDSFSSNNKYYKAVKVIQRPLIFLASQKSSPLEASLREIYNVDVGTELPSNLGKYSSVIINDIPAQDIAPKIDLLNNYVSDGNGLFVIGGERSFDRDDSLKSLDGGVQLYQSLLPVKVGAGEEGEKSDVNIMVVIDASSGTASHIGLEKALAISVIESLHPDNNVGVITFYSDGASRKIGLVTPILPLKQHINETKDKISRLSFGGQSYFDYGILSAHELLKSVSGSKNIIFISDGSTTYSKLKEDTRQAALDVANRGTKIYVVGVGSSIDETKVIIGGSSKRDDELLSQIALFGNGAYFPTDASNRLNILFGKQDKSQKETDFFNSLSILESTHFITYNLSLGAVVSGYNLVIPKPASRLLVTTNKNIPMVTVWRFGIGRVATLATDDGTKWGGELLTKKNSKLITKIVNWVIGDMSRNKEFDVSIRDTGLGRDTDINVVSNELPKAKGLTFYKRDVNLYSTSYTPKETGFHTVLGAEFAVNYNDEYENLGLNPEFLKLVESSGGEVFEPENTDDILSTIKRVSKRIKVHSTNYAYVVIIVALITFIYEIFYRRINEKSKEL
ncbi:MAG: VWA domain-containing protein [Candidatus Woesearchaeota archaeon]|nr:VWA domain-containing protein [Candidatus Woesearchaeota archaeon]